MNRKHHDKLSLFLLSSMFLVSCGSVSSENTPISYELKIKDDGLFYLLGTDGKEISLFMADSTCLDLTPVKKDGEWYLAGDDLGVSAEHDITSGLYLGFDDYIWDKEKKTGYHLVGAEHGLDIENTLALSEVSSSYYPDKGYSLSIGPIILMDGYQKNTRVTEYSGVNLTSFSIEVKEAGRLSIGTCKVRNAVNSVEDGDHLFNTEKISFEAVQGINQIDVNVAIAEDETLTLSGDAVLSMYESIPSDSGQGTFAFADDTCHDSLLRKKGGIADRIALRSISDENLSSVREKKTEDLGKIREKFSQKTFSVLGDSLSAFDGTCNDGSINSHIADNLAFYSDEKGDITDESQMWYSQIQDDFDMKLLVDNACSGSTVIRKEENDDYCGYMRCPYLSPDQGEYKDKAPDYIFVLLGGNDCLMDSAGSYPVTYSEPTDDLMSSLKNEDGYIEPELYDFTSAYMIMIDQIMSLYPTSQIYIIGSFEIPLSALEEYWNALNVMNDNLEKISQYFHTGYLCLRNHEGLKKDVVGPDLIDQCHPGRKGFNFFSDEIEIELIQSALFSEV